MRYTLTLFAAGVLLAANMAYAGNPTGGAISATPHTNTAVRIAITTAPTAVDSVFICKFDAGSADTTFVSLVDSTAATYIISGQSPNSTAYWFLLTRQGAGEKTALSAKDTVTTYGPEIEATPGASALHLVEKMIRAVSWRPSTVYTTFTINGPTGADSTGHYRPWKAHGITVKASQAGDSVNVMAYIAYGKRDMKQTGETFGFAAYSDSLNITGPGVFRKTLTANVASETMYIKFAGYNDNGKNAAIEIEYVRDRY
jgi:hypothetical protein